MVVMRVCLQSVCVVCNKSKPLRAAGLSDSENSGLSLAYFQLVQSLRLGSAFSDSVRTAFGQMKIRRCASAPSRASSSGKSPHHSVFHIPLPLVPRFLWTSPRTHTSVARSNASLPQNKNDNKFPVEHNRRDDWGAEI